jgi:serine phosphatase RsbU (regulator of sigma subunit)
MRETRSPRGPLGITGEVIYSETSLHLRPADTLTCVSDGVAEARNAEGTLFGFDRTQSIISQPAQALPMLRKASDRKTTSPC